MPTELGQYGPPVLRLYHSALGRSGTSLALLLLGLGRAGERAAAKDPPAGPAHK
ncbi:hypothetical protein [Streptomyces sp. NPDC001601]|uniref:hypothetical protein n=1 Tax=Streptomyces sp. NPDC001601 TaxID=3364592 RepID=UPI0036C16A2F